MLTVRLTLKGSIGIWPVALLFTLRRSKRNSERWRVGIGRRALIAVMAVLAVVADDELGDALAERLIDIRGTIGKPNGLFGLGYDEIDSSAPEDAVRSRS